MQDLEQAALTNLTQLMNAIKEKNHKSFEREIVPMSQNCKMLFPNVN